MLSAKCPDCSTRFRVTPEHLRAAGGWVRCGSCGAVFDALKSLDETRPATPADSKRPEPAPAQIENPFLREPQPTPTKPLPPKQLDLRDEPPEGEAPRPSSDFGPTEDLPRDPTPEQTAIDAAPATRAASPMPFDIPPGLPDLESANPEAAAGGSLVSRLAWGLGSLALVLILALQLAWFERGKLIYHPTGHAMLQEFCRLAGCRLPERRDLERLEIVSRDIRPEAGVPPRLALRLVFANLADHAQPYPRVQLSLFSESGELVAQRAFLPDEYLEAPPRELLAPQEQVRISLELQQPATPVSGFRFEFL